MLFNTRDFPQKIDSFKVDPYVTLMRETLLNDRAAEFPRFPNSRFAFTGLLRRNHIVHRHRLGFEP